MELKYILFDMDGVILDSESISDITWDEAAKEYNVKMTANPNTFISSVLNRDNGEYIVAYTIETTPEQEAKMIEKAMKDGDGWGFNCADNVSDVMKEIGFNHVITPGGLEQQLQKSDKVTEIKEYKNE